MGPVLRRCTLRIISAFRTVSQMTAHVIAEIKAIEVLTEERSALYQQRSQIPRIKETERRERQKSLRRWQKLWDNSTKDRLTQRLIPSSG